jgi:hypothetical protein
MKAMLLWLIPVATLLASCEKTEEPAAANPKASKPVSLRSKAPKQEEAPALEESAPIVEADAPATPPSSPFAPLADAAPAPVVPAAPTGPLSQEQRDAYRAEQRAKRAAEMSERITARFKESDADGDGMLTQGEIPERMQRGFTRADTNGDGSLDATEQETLIQNLSERMAENNGRDRRGMGRRGRRGGN